VVGREFDLSQAGLGTLLAELTALALTCAPNIHPTTLEALVLHESRAKAYAIGVNGPKRRNYQPKNLESAVAIVQDLIAKGIDFDAGLGQINVRNWDWLGLTAETVFDPCTNLAAAQTVLSDCYSRASRSRSEEQLALRAALSCYNTGNFKRGFANGYVSKVVAKATVKVPALVATPGTAPDQPSGSGESGKKRTAPGMPDGFTANGVPDGFQIAQSSPSP